MLRVIPFATTSTVPPPPTPAGSNKESSALKNEKKKKSWRKKLAKKSSNLRKAFKKLFKDPFKQRIHSKKNKAKSKRESESGWEDPTAPGPSGVNPPPTELVPEPSVSGSESEGSIAPVLLCPGGEQISNKAISRDREESDNMAYHYGGNSNSNNSVGYGKSRERLSKPLPRTTSGPMKAVHTAGTSSTSSAGLTGGLHHRSQQQQRLLPSKIHVPKVGTVKESPVDPDRRSRYVVNGAQQGGVSPSTRRRSRSPSPVVRRRHSSLSSSSTTTYADHQARRVTPPSSGTSGITRGRSHSFSGATPSSLLDRREKTTPPRVRSPSPPSYQHSAICTRVVRHGESVSKLLNGGLLNNDDKVNSGSSSTLKSSHRRGSPHHKSLNKVDTSSSSGSSQTYSVSTPRERRRQQKTLDDGGSHSKTVSFESQSGSSSHRVKRSNSLSSLTDSSSVADCLEWKTTSSRRRSYTHDREGQNTGLTKNSSQPASSGQSRTPAVSTAAKSKSGQDKLSKSSGQQSSGVDSKSSVDQKSVSALSRLTKRLSLGSRLSSSGSSSSSLEEDDKSPKSKKEKSPKTKSKGKTSPTDKSKEEKSLKSAHKDSPQQEAKPEEKKEVVRPSEPTKLSKLLKRVHNYSALSGDEELETAITKEGGMNGLRNLGNTCFMNSMLQCLSQTVELTNVFIASDTLEMGAVSKAYTQLLLQLWVSPPSPTASPFRRAFLRNGRGIDPAPVKKAMGSLYTQYKSYDEQDSQEFLRYFVSSLHDELKRDRGFLPPPNTLGLSPHEHGDAMWKWMRKLDDSPVARVFMGQLKSTLQCSVCDWSSSTFDPFWDIAVPFPNKQRMHNNPYMHYHVSLELEACLKKFASEEVLDGDNKPICGHCRKARKCTKRISLHKLPPVMVLVLKRFSTDYYKIKMGNKVAIPQMLDLRPYVSKETAGDYSKGGAIHYELYATSNHTGGCFTGHYTAWVKHFGTNQWFTINDASATKNTKDSPTAHFKINTTEAYVLFYRQVLTT